MAWRFLFPGGRSRHGGGQGQAPRIRGLVPRILVLHLLTLFVHTVVGTKGLTAAPAEATVGLTTAVESLAFRLEAVDGTPFVLEPTSDDRPSRWTVVCFLGTECPLARLYADRLNQLALDHADDGVRFVGVMSNHQDSREDIVAYSDEHRLRFPLVRDDGNRIADRFGATRTPEVFVLDHRLAIRYQGRIDDQYAPGVARPQPQRRDLQETLEALVAGRVVEHPRTGAAGCLIGRVRPPAASPRVTYCDQIARLLAKHCLECHRAGEIGPMALTDFDEVVGWGETMLEVVEQRRMPPWHATSAHAPLQNARGMTPEEIGLLRDWVSDGMPYGRSEELPPPIAWASGWQLAREPDQVVEMRGKPFGVPASGTVEYQYFVVDPGWKEDRWISAAQVVPGNAGVVHHAIVFVRPPDGSEFRGVGWLAAYVPGQRATVLPAGRARHVPAGSRLVFQMHYTPNGEPREDQTKLGVLFADPREVTHEVYTVIGIDQDFEIPPGAAQHVVEGRVRNYPERGELLSIVPHMHLRGRSFQFQVDREAGSQTLLDVPRYDFNWQHEYLLAESLPLHDVKALRFTATFDNSADNPANPDPGQYVTWGDQTWEEMAVAFFNVAVPRKNTVAETTSLQDASRSAADPAMVAEPTVSPAAAEYASDFFQRYDRNGDGWVDKDEPPLAVRKFLFQDFDRDGNQRLDRDEVSTVATERLK